MAKTIPTGRRRVKAARQTPRDSSPTSPDQILEIALRRTACLGSCPVYEVTLRRDGSALYHGAEFAPRQGDFRGEIPSEAFRQLATLVLEHRFFALQPGYWKPITCNPSAITTVRLEDRVKVVDDYAEAGPPALRRLEKAIDRAADNVAWHPDPAGPSEWAFRPNAPPPKEGG